MNISLSNTWTGRGVAMIAIMSVAMLGFLFIAMQITSATHNTDGLIGYWPLDDGGGLTADVSGHGNDATLTNGPTFDIGNKAPIVGNVSSILFDGTNDFLDVPHDSELDVDEATVSAWIYMASDISAGTKNIVRKGHFSNRVFGLDIDGGTKKIRGFVVLGATGGAANIVNGSTALSVAAWHYVAMTYDGTNVRVYVDGVLDGTSAVASGTISDNTLSVRIGGQPLADPGGALAFKGNIDEVRIYDRELTLPEIEALHDYEFGIDSDDPEIAFNPVGTEHTVEVTIDPALAGIPVLFDIDGSNSAESDTVMTDGDGVASFTYIGANQGEDTITVCVDANDDDDCDEEESFVVVKTWFLRHFVTGGGVIKGSKPQWTFGGMVGRTDEGEIVGNFQIVDHVGKRACHLNDFSLLEFSGGTTESPVSGKDIAMFVGSGSCNNGGDVNDVTVVIHDDAEPGAVADTIELTGVGSDISAGTFISGGNFQVHPPEEE